MTRAIEEEGATVDEAVQNAVDKLGAEVSQVDVEVIRAPSKGFLGLGGDKALVRVTVKEEAQASVKEDARAAETLAIMHSILDALDIDANVEIERGEEHVQVSITGKAGIGRLIGRRGEMLAAVQTVVNAALRKLGEGPRVVIDIEGYRKRRIDDLKQVARRAADRVSHTGRPVALGPMNSYERRVIHVALKDDPEVVTESEGEEPDREVVIFPR